jgi:hypothetical protein
MVSPLVVCSRSIVPLFNASRRLRASGIGRNSMASRYGYGWFQYSVFFSIENSSFGR